MVLLKTITINYRKAKFQNHILGSAQPDSDGWQRVDSN